MRDISDPAVPGLVLRVTNSGDLCRTGRTTLGRFGVMPFIAERVINHSKDVLEEIMIFGTTSTKSETRWSDWSAISTA